MNKSILSLIAILLMGATSSAHAMSYAQYKQCKKHTSDCGVAPPIPTHHIEVYYPYDFVEKSKWTPTLKRMMNNDYKILLRNSQFSGEFEKSITAESTWHTAETMRSNIDYQQSACIAVSSKNEMYISIGYGTNPYIVKTYKNKESISSPPDKFKHCVSQLMGYMSE